MNETCPRECVPVKFSLESKVRIVGGLDPLPMPQNMNENGLIDASIYEKGHGPLSLCGYQAKGSLDLFSFLKSGKYNY